MAAEDENSALLQSKARVRLEIEGDYDYTKCEISKDSHVPCPGSSSMCAGDQCCPGTKDSGEKTFPCPSASDKYSSCASSKKIKNCTKTKNSAAMLLEGDYDYTKCEISKDSHVPCPGSSSMCAGDQCCPGTKDSGEKTFPCPSASDKYSSCASSKKIKNCTKTKKSAAMLLEGDYDYTKCEISKDSHVPCPGSSSMCAGDQCCPG